MLIRMKKKALGIILAPRLCYTRLKRGARNSSSKELSELMFVMAKWLLFI